MKESPEPVQGLNAIPEPAEPEQGCEAKPEPEAQPREPEQGFLDQHPYSTWTDFHYRVCRARGWQLVLGATPSLPIWEACDSWE